MQVVPLGRGGPLVSRAGLELMAMSGGYGPADDAESIATIRAGLDGGFTLLDTGDFYGMGRGEMLLRQALRWVARDTVFIGVKFGGSRARTCGGTSACRPRWRRSPATGT